MALNDWVTPESPPSYTDMMALVREVANLKGKQCVRDIFALYGGQRLREIPAERYKSLKKSLEGVL